MIFLYNLFILKVFRAFASCLFRGREFSCGKFVNHKNKRATIRISSNSTLNAMRGCRSMSSADEVPRTVTVLSCAKNVHHSQCGGGCFRHLLFTFISRERNTERGKHFKGAASVVEFFLLHDSNLQWVLSGSSTRC